MARRLAVAWKTNFQNIDTKKEKAFWSFKWFVSLYLWIYAILLPFIDNFALNVC